MKRLASTAAARIFLLGLLAAGPAAFAQGGPIATGALQIQGNRLTIYADELTTDADQTVNVGERARVRTCYGGAGVACGSVLPGDPRISGMLVRGELRGPEVPQAIALETVPGGTFVLPGFQQEGDYRLENIRLVDALSGQVLATAEPSFAVLHVREILLASATVRTLSLAELQARGITFSAENFQAFNFAVGFAFGDEIVEIEFPMVYSGYGTVEPLDKPTVNLDGLPSDLAHAVERWQPPNIVPFRLEVEDSPALRADEEEDETLHLPLFGAIVIPGNVSYLNQFFEARVIVANGAPQGSDARLGQVQASLRLPPYNALRVVASDPSVAPGQAVPVVKANGGRLLFPGDQGSAAWTVEGLTAGTHTLQMDITASLERPGRDSFPLLSRIQAAVEVVDARFNLTFSHPDVVREGEAYSLFVTVTNLSRATQNLITVDLDEQRITGAHRANPQDTLKRTIQTLAPGQAETLEFPLVADLDGKVVATTFQSTSSVGQGTIRLRTGVGELGIPLSPATLVLPRFSEQLKKTYIGSDDLYTAHIRFLGLAYSLAVAPAALTPAGLPRVIKTDVERRAVDFAQAGQRTWIGEPLLESLEVLALDYLGNRHPLIEIDELRRSTGKGLAVGTELARQLRKEQDARNLSAADLFDQLAETTTYTAPYAAALLLPDDGSEALALEVRGAYDGIPGSLSGAAGTAGALRTLAFGEIYPVLRDGSGEETVPFALVGHVALDQVLEVVVRNPGASVAQGRLLVIIPEAGGSEDRRLEIPDVTVPPGGAVMLRVGAAVAHPVLADAATGTSLGVNPSVSRVDRPSFRLIGARQDFRMKEDGPDELGNMIRPNRYGNGVIYLFNRPPAAEGAEDEANYRIRSRFSGLDTAGQPASGTSDKTGTGAWLQDDGRTVAVRYATPVSALINPANNQPLLTHEHLLDTHGLVDAWGESLDAAIPSPRLETLPLHVGGLVTGKVVRGTGEPVVGAKVQLIRSLLWETRMDTIVKLDYLGEVTTGSDGSFFFDFVETPHWDRQVLPRFTLRAYIPAGADPALQPEEVQEVSSTIRLQNRVARINIALLGRGTIRGRFLYADTNAPVTGGRVLASSTLFNEEKAVQPAADGSFVIAGVPVGPITLTGRDPEGRVVYATVGVSGPGVTVDSVLLLLPRVIPGMGTVTGTVVGATSDAPIAGARVAVYSKGAMLSAQETDDFGRFRFEQVPEGQVSLQAANWAVSRISIFTDLQLAANAVEEVTLRLPEGASRTVTGSVFFHDPITNTNVPVQGAVAFIEGPGVFAYTDAAGAYRIEGVPVQGANESYSVKAIDFSRKLEGRVSLPPILDVSPDVVAAQSIVLQQMSGGIDGVVLDPLGRPAGGAEVVVYPYGTTTSAADGSFSFASLPLGGHTVVAHVGDGLQAGKVGYFGEAPAQIVYGGHRPFVQVRMGGSGVVTLLTRTATSTGVLTPVYYKPTYYSAVEYRVRLKGAYTETTTDPNGRLQLVLPVGKYELIAYNPFHGIHTISGEITYAGQVVDHEVVFEDAATVAGVVVNVDGVTPVPDIEVTMEATGLKGQKQRTDTQGRFRFELVPKGRVMITAEGLAGSVERVGRTLGYVGTAGQELELVVQMKAQGTVTGRVIDRFNGVDRPLANAQYYVQENSFPFRRLPQEGAWYVTDSQGRYQVPHVYAGSLSVIARDSGQVGRWGQSDGNLTADWQVLSMPDIVMTTSVGSLQITVRDPISGGPVADAQVRLSNDDATVTGADGIAFFDALPLGSYSVYTFYAPSGRSGRLTDVSLSSAGQKVVRTVYLDQRGDVRGTLWDDAAKTVKVAGGIVRLSGETAGGRVTALATTSSAADNLGRFEFQGIPEGSFQLEAAAPTSPRRASATATLTATSPIVDLNLILEPAGDLYFRLYEKLKAGTSAVNLTGGVFSLRLTQQGYDYAQLAPVTGSSNFRFPGVLLSRAGGLGAEELTGERRTGGASFTNFTATPPVAGTGTSASPYQIVLGAKGTVRVVVRDAAGRPVSGANVNLSTSQGSFPSVTGSDGTVTFAAVPAGQINASASSLANGTGGFSTATLTFDDELIEMSVALAPAVAAHGVIYQPVLDDRWTGDLAQLVPAPGILVQITDSKGRTQLVATDAQGSYRFGALSTGGYQLTARSSNGDQLATRAGSLSGPDGNDNELPFLILDAAPPRLLSIAPPPGLEGVSRTAAVELVFSEALDAAVLPVNAGNPAAYFNLRSATGAWAQGTWSSALDATGRQVVRFVPSVAYENFTVYSLTVAGGSGGVRDRMGRPLTASGNVGSNFKTSDGVGPAVIGTDPDLGRPVDPRRVIRIDFSEAVKATDEQLDGDLTGDALELYWQRDTGSGVEWRRLPVILYLTRSNFSISVQVPEGLSLQGDTLQRRLVLSGLEDVYGNAMPAYERTFRMWDGRAPRVDAVPFPAGAPDGQLLQGQKYELTPLLANLDDVTAANPGGDVDRVDYYFEDPTDPQHPVSPSYSARKTPFSYSFFGAYSGDGVTPRQFPVWVRAVDTSTNQSNVVQVAMVVLPNTKPSVEAVNASATSPVPGVFYAGSSLVATVGGFYDLDSSQMTLFVELWQEGAATFMASTGGKTVTRPTGGWNAAPSETASFQIPLSLAEGTRLYFRARVIDPNGAVGITESERFAVADDNTPVVIDDFSVRLGGAPVTHLFIGEEFYLEVKAHDAETGISTVTLSLDRTDLFPQALTATLVPGTKDLYRSATLVVPAGMKDPIPVRATVRTSDYGGNSQETSAQFQVGPERDPSAPAARWIAPWQGALWPADYTSVVSATDGAALLLRFYARDTNLDVDGNPVPGRLVTVEVRGPRRNAQTGAIELASTWIAASKVAGTEDLAGAQYQAMWRVPNGLPVGTEVPFETRLVDSAGTETITRVTMTAVAPRQVYEGAITTIGVTDPMRRDGWSETGPAFLLDGTTLSLFPRSDGTVRHLPALFVYTGGSTDTGALVVRPSVLTAPEITSYDSAILFYPLELAVDQELGVGYASRIDMTRKGLLGSTSAKSMVLPDETGAQARAGGSHGGRGWFGSQAGGWNRTDLAQPGSVYDSLRDPRLPGGGGASADTTAGGAGGGVIRLFAENARVHLDGEIQANGGSGSGGGGAGGAIRLTASRLEGIGSLQARGGAGSFYNNMGGGGGGRVSFTYRELAPAVNLATQIDATGGHNDSALPSRADRLAGAGTIYLEAIDPVTGLTGPGRLVLRNPVLPERAGLTLLPALGDGAVYQVDAANSLVVLNVAKVRGNVAGDQVALAAADGSSLGSFPITAQRRVTDAGGAHVELTVAAAPGQLDAAAAELALGHAVAFHGASRLLAVDAEGPVRLVADDDLLLNAPGAEALNDHTAVALRRGARAALRGEGPVVTYTATPVPGTQVILGSSVQVEWSVSDPLGLTETKTESSAAPTPVPVSLYDEPITAKSTAATTLSIPLTAAPASVSYTVEATNQAGRKTRQPAVWPVLPNQLPAGQVTLAAGTQTPVRAGYPFTVVVHAEDRERLAKVTLQATGPVSQATQVATTSGTAVDLSFTVQVLASADSSQPVVLQALLEDASGGSATTAPLSIPVAANGAPTGSVGFAAGAADHLEPGRSTTLKVHAEDADGLTRIDLHAVGAVTQLEQTKTVTGTSVDATFTLTAKADAAPDTAVSVTATLVDALGGTATTAAFVIQVVANGVPSGSVALATGAPSRIEPGRSTTVVVHAADSDGLAKIDLHATGGVTQPEQSKTVTGTSTDATFTLTAAAGVTTPQTVSVTATVVDLVGSTATTAALTFDIVADVDQPVVTLTLSPDRGAAGIYRSGEVVSVTASATDDVAVASLQLVVDGVTTTSTGAPVTYAWTVPALSGAATYTFAATATDSDGNQGTATRAVNASPLPADLPPAVSFTCPTNGALLPGDTTVSLSAAASDDAGVTAVRFYLGDAATPFAQTAPTGSPKQTTASATFNLATTTGPTVRFRVEASDTAGQVSSQTIEVQLVTAVNLKADGQGTNDWTALAGQVAVLRSGTLTIDDQPVTLGGLLVLNGATVTHTATPSNTSPKKLELTVNGPLYVGCGGLLDVTARGYAAGVTYPAHTASNSGGSGGSHLGEGSTSGAPYETFGSVYFPRENGSGSGDSGRGGGAVRVTAQRLQVDGTIRANGGVGCRGGAGGSVWVRTDALGGGGTIEAKGGNGTCNNGDWTGGGGAIAVEHTSLDAGSTLLDQLKAQGGTASSPGGAGTVYVKGGSAPVYGNLIVDNGTLSGTPRTVLPSLGKGVAGAASSGATLATGRAKPIPAYFVGHWIEVRDGATGTLEGTWRIASIATDNLTVTLAANAGEAVTVNPGDAWQGVYRFDNYTIRGSVRVDSADPIRVTGDQVIAGPMTTASISAGRLVVEPTGSITQSLTPSSAAPESISIEVGELVVKAGGVIDVSARGYAAGVTYPNHAASTTGGSGGSHLGEGSTSGSAYETFGSVYFPRENGSGSGDSGRGGGAVRVVAQRAQIDGAIRANGGPGCRGGAGGSVWVRTGALSGTGTIEAKGGDGTCNNGDYTGGGGAISVEHTSLEAGTTLLDQLKAYGGKASNPGGAGTVYVKGGSAPTYGHLIVDNATWTGRRRTVLPPLGNGTAQAGSAGAALVTGRAKAVPAYFVGHWVEVRNGQTGVLEGTWRVVSISADGFTVTLASNAGEPVTVDAGDAWQGVYRFDQFTVKGDVQVVSADPIRVASEQVITGTVETDAIYADRLVVKAGGTLTQRFTASPSAPESLTIQVRELVVESGGVIDVSARGYVAGVTYPAHAASPGGGSGGSHLGEGSTDGSAPYETFGSVYFPRENGSGSGSGGRGGGAVRVVAERAQIDGTIRSNGGPGCRGGAGGSVWVRTGALSGAGTIEVKGGGSTCNNGDYTGGGGAIAVEYTSLETGSTLLNQLKAQGGTATNPGGAGTVYVKGGAASAYGHLIVDNAALTGRRRTVLPPLGKGTALAGSAGTVLATGRAKAIPAYFVGHWVEIRNGSTGLLEGTWRVASIGTDGFTVTLAANAGEPVTVDAGDAWQGVYRLDQYTVKGDVQVVSADPIRVASEQVITGTVETDAIYADRLVVKAGGTLTQRFTASPSAPESLTIQVRELVVESGGVIDVSARGYLAGMTYPGHAASTTGGSGGSHLGEGSTSGSAYETFGSVYFPRENGSGSGDSGRGAGAVRVVAERAQIDGAIRANGGPGCRGGAGGSVWVQTGALSGTGTIEAKGGDGTCNNGDYTGGGGAIAVEHTSLEAGTTLLDQLKAQGGKATNPGGAGTVWVKGGSAPTYGHLIVDNAAWTGRRRTVLPALGKGTAQQGSAGAVLATGRAKIPVYFVGHWIEVRDGQTGVLEGTWRVAEILLDGVTVILASNAGEPVTVDAGDAWQGVYQLDQYTVRGDVQVVSPDPIRVRADQTVAGTLETDSVSAGRLVVKTGATLTQRLTGSATESLAIDVKELVVESGGLIDVTARGYAAGVTYPSHLASNTSGSGGSHLGEGSTSGTAYETFGSVVAPRENGSGSGSSGRGGGAVRITAAERVQIDGVIRANGEKQCRGGAGGSVWLRTGALSGAGTIEVKGGDGTCNNGDYTGGGGAIAVEHTSLEAGTTLLDHLKAQGGTATNPGGAGTVWVKGGSAPVYGQLIVDNGTLTGRRRTILPSLGKGAAQAGSAGAVLATGRAKAIPAYFVGHWVEVRNGQTGVLEGTWRIASIAADGFTATLAANAGEPVTVDAGDAWQGVYRFDQYTVKGDVQVLSADPIRVSSEQVITGTFETDAIYADRLVVKPGATLTQRLTGSASAPESLTIEVRELTVESGGAIDVSARGYAAGVTYPGHATSPSSGSGGSHLGEGGTDGTAYETFGSVTFPRENGSGSGSTGRGGGAVRVVVTERARIDGAIRANGGVGCRGGAGGSVWLRAGTLGGAGTLEATGGGSTCNGGDFAGGGGAIAVEYASLDAASTLLDHLQAQGATASKPGGAGTVYLRGPGATLGSLAVDNKNLSGIRRTVLPSLGRGIVQTGSAGNILVTGRSADVPGYFVGHWVEIEGPDRFVKGVWRIASIQGTTVTLEPKPGQPVSFAPGDRWRGIYRFDQVTVGSNSVLVSADALVQTVPPLPAGAGRSGIQSITSSAYEGLYGNDEAPAWERSAVSIAVGAVSGSYRITLAPNAVADPDGISEVLLTSGGRAVSAAWSTEGVSFLWSGRPGQRLHLVATDAHPRFRRSGWLELPALPDGGWAPPLELAPGVTPLAVTGGADWLALADNGLWLYGTAPQPAAVVPPRAADDEVVALAGIDSLLLSATRDRIDVVDRTNGTVEEVPATSGAVLDLAPGDGAAVVLLADASDPLLPMLRLAQLLLPSGEPPVLLPADAPAVPMLENPVLHRTDGFLHLLGRGAEGQGVIYTWPSVAPGEPIAADPEIWESPAGWRAAGPWRRGAVVVDGTSVRLLEHGADGWTEVSQIELPAEAWSAAVTGEGGDVLVVLLPGSIALYDVTNPAAPTPLSTHPGSSYRKVEPLPGGQVLLWSPRMAAPPLRWDPATAVPGAGFQTVIPGLP